MKRLKLGGVPATYHAMSRVVGGQRLFGDREKEVLRKMLWQVADFCGDFDLLCNVEPLPCIGPGAGEGGSF